MNLYEKEAGVSTFKKKSFSASSNKDMKRWQWLWLSWQSGRFCPEVHGSYPVIGKNLYWTITDICIEKTKIMKKRPGMAHF